MAEKQKRILERAVAHMERFELEAADEMIEEYDSQGYVAGRNPMFDWDDSRKIASRISAARSVADYWVFWRS